MIAYRISTVDQTMNNEGIHVFLIQNAGYDTITCIYMCDLCELSIRIIMEIKKKRASLQLIDKITMYSMLMGRTPNDNSNQAEKRGKV